MFARCALPVIEKAGGKVLVWPPAAAVTSPPTTALLTITVHLNTRWQPV